MSEFIDGLKARPIIAAVRDSASLEAACRSNANVIFLLGGRLLELEDWVGHAHEHGKRVLLHLDLCEGLGRDAAAVAYCAARIRPDGVISTRAPLIKCADECGLETVQRMFLMDSQSLLSGVKLLKNSPCALVEVLPGLVPKAISFIGAELGRPVIAGGMITTRAEVEQALSAGAVAVSTSCAYLWDEIVESRES